MRNNVNAIYYSFGIIVSRIIALVTFSLFSYFLSKQGCKSLIGPKIT